MSINIDFINALETDNLSRFIYIYKNYRYDISKNRDNKTLVYYSCNYGRFKILKFLLENNSDFESSPLYPLHNPLYTAFFRGYLDCAALIVVEMLKKGKNISKLPRQLRTHFVVEGYMSRMAYLNLFEGCTGFQRHYLLNECILQEICSFVKIK